MTAERSTANVRNQLNNEGPRRDQVAFLAGRTPTQYLGGLDQRRLALAVTAFRADDILLHSGHIVGDFQAATLTNIL